MIVVILLILALVVWWLAQRLGRLGGLPRGRVVYTDTGAWGRPEKPLFSRQYQLTGKPDYLVQAGAVVLPVEVKSGAAPAGGPYDSHVFQLAAYCLLVEETYGRRPAYGLIKYADKTLAVDFTAQLKADLLGLLEEMRAADLAEDVSRSHNSAARCRACGFRDGCGEEID